MNRYMIEYPEILELNNIGGIGTTDRYSQNVPARLKEYSLTNSATLIDIS